MPPYRIVVLNLQEFTTLVASAVTELFPAYVRFVRTRVVSAEKLLELSRMIVLDPAEILRRELAGPQ